MQGRMSEGIFGVVGASHRIVARAFVARGIAAGVALASCLPRVEVASDSLEPDAGIAGAGTGGDGVGGGGPSAGGSSPGAGGDGASLGGLEVADGGVGGVGGSGVGGSGIGGSAGSESTDTTAPSAPLTLVDVQPPPSAAEVSIDAPLALTFSANIDAASLSGLTVELLRANSLPISGALSVAGPEVRFVPSEPLLLTNSYVWRFRGALRSVDGAEWTGDTEAPFRTREGDWSLAENLSSAGENPRLAFDGAGNALAIWNQPGLAESGAAGLGAARFTPDGGWQMLSSPATCGPQCTPTLVAGGDDGAFMVTWYAEDYLRMRRYHPDTGFGDVETIQSRSGPPAADGAVSDGQLWMAAHLVFGIAATRTRDGSAWSQTSVYSDDTGQSSSGPVLVVDGPERARVFWVQSPQLLASTFSEGSWSAPQFVPSFRGDFTAVGLTGDGVASGNALLAWEEDRPSQDDASALTSYLGVALMAPNGSVREEGAPALPDGVGGNPASPGVSMNPRGEALLTWLQSAGDPNDAEAPASVWGVFHGANAATWSVPVQLSDNLNGVARPPAVGLDPSGNGHVVWASYRSGAGANVLTTRYLREGGLFGATGLLANEAVAPGLTRGPRSGNDNCQLAVDASGRALALFVGPEGGIWALRFE